MQTLKESFAATETRNSRNYPISIVTRTSLLEHMSPFPHLPDCPSTISYSWSALTMGATASLSDDARSSTFSPHSRLPYFHLMIDPKPGTKDKTIYTANTILLSIMVRAVIFAACQESPLTESKPSLASQLSTKKAKQILGKACSSTIGLANSISKHAHAKRWFAHLLEHVFTSRMLCLQNTGDNDCACKPKPENKPEENKPEIISQANLLQALLDVGLHIGPPSGEVRSRDIVAVLRVKQSHA